MQIVVFDYFTNEITLFPLQERIEKLMKEDEDFNLSEYMEMLPGYSSYCYFMAAENIKLRFGNQNDFDEFKDEEDD